MKTHSFSIIIGNNSCNAKCPYCVARMTPSISKCIVINETKFAIAVKIVEKMRDGLLTVMLTGKGEPLLFPKQIMRYLELLDGKFPLIELQTNGILIEQQIDLLEKWKLYGLTLVSLSIAGETAKKSRQIMGIQDDQYDYWKTASMLKDIGLSVRLNCTMTEPGVHTNYQAETIIQKAFLNDIDQVTFREVEMPYNSEDSVIKDWVTSHKPHGSAERLHKYLASQGAVRLLELPGGGIVYDDDGQNVAISNCLTRTTDTDDLRQVIFFPSGELMYDWCYKGARLL